jgi:hypothetical protein
LAAKGGVMQIDKIKDGGYLVSDSHRGEIRGGFDYVPFQFASTTIDEALKYIKSKLEPKATK